jgi:raffinose/stachyose/melibiose transport system permease protein
MSQTYTRRTFGFEILMLVGAAVFCLPLYLLVTMAFKPAAKAASHPFSLPLPPVFGNFSTAMSPNGVSEGLGRALISSTIITFSSVVALIVIGSMCAYVVARRPGKLSGALYICFVLGIILPFQLSIIPLYRVFLRLGLVGNYLGVIILYVGILMPITVFLYTGFIRTLPKDYEEAARVDGAREWRVFGRVVLPLLLPITGTVAILGGLFVWNDFFVSVIFLAGSSVQTVPVAIYSFVGEYTSQWQYVFAALLIGLLPVIAFFVIAQKWMIRGFSGGIRG